MRLQRVQEPVQRGERVGQTAHGGRKDGAVRRPGGQRGEQGEEARLAEAGKGGRGSPTVALPSLEERGCLPQRARLPYIRSDASTLCVFTCFVVLTTNL